jgi:hypothetical protein
MTSLIDLNLNVLRCFIVWETLAAEWFVQKQLKDQKVLKSELAPVTG